MAAACQPGEVIALEAKKDANSFWLARTDKIGNSCQYNSSSKVVDGVTFRDGLWYITMTVLERYPADCDYIFQELADEPA